MRALDRGYVGAISGANSTDGRSAREPRGAGARAGLNWPPAADSAAVHTRAYAERCVREGPAVGAWGAWGACGAADRRRGGVAST